MVSPLSPSLPVVFHQAFTRRQARAGAVLCGALGHGGDRRGHGLCLRERGEEEEMHRPQALDGKGKGRVDDVHAMTDEDYKE